MKIEIWLDYVCPFCYIGERKFEQALEELDMKNEVEITFKSFELSPDAPKKSEGSIHEIIAKKYGMSVQDATKNNNKIVESAKQLGMVINFDDIKPTNTFDAHRLSYYAKENGQVLAYTKAVMRSYFTESLDISDHEILSNIAAEVGLDKKEAKRILASDDYSQQVRKSEKEARSKGIDGVPCFIFEGKEALYGAQPVEEFINVITKVKDSLAEN